MEEQKERARAHWKGDAFDFSVISGKVKPTEYTGEDCYNCEGSIQIIVKNNEIVKTASENEDIVIVTDKSPFYAERGGQTGDFGLIEKNDARIEINNTKIFDNVILHFGRILYGNIKEKDAVSLKVDQKRKEAIARNHTATHLIHKALRTVAGEHAAQSGSLVGPDFLRFDFTHSKALTKDEIENIENEVNRIVLENHPVKITRMSKDEAIKSGAVAIFEEKYGEVVRVVEVSGYSRELCGGTHVRQSGDIGLIKIISESSISAGTRRIEALTGMNSLQNYRDYFNKIKQLSAQFNVDDEKLMERIENYVESSKEKEKEITELKKQLAKHGAQELLSKAKKIGSHEIIIERVDMDPDTMMTAVDEFKSNIKSGVIFLISTSAPEKVSIIAGVTKSLINVIKAGDIAKETAKIAGGGGGGRPDMAQAGGKDPSQMDAALKKAKEMIEAAVK
jgi:alanyl-tRNA synthetase